MVNYSEVEATGLANPQNMFMLVGVIIGIGIVVLIAWSIYQWLT
jgi:hypothetical protein